MNNILINYLKFIKIIAIINDKYCNIYVILYDIIYIVDSNSCTQYLLVYFALNQTLLLSSCQTKVKSKIFF